MLGLAGIKRIKDGVLREVIQNKESILQDRISTFTKTQTGKFLSQLETINISVKQNLLNLQQCDQEQLKHKLTTLTEKLDSVRSEVKGIFESSAVDARKYIKSIEEIVDGEVANFLDFRIHQKSEDKHYTIRAGLFGWKRNITQIRSPSSRPILRRCSRTYAVMRIDATGRRIMSLASCSRLKI